MASVYRRKRYAPIPANAVIVTMPEKGGMNRRIAKWTDAGGAERRAEVKSDARFGDRIVVEELDRWYIAYEGEHGRKYQVGYTDKAASEALAGRLEKEAARRREGLIEQYDDHMKRPITEHLDDFMVTRPGNARSQLYIDQIRNRIERLIKGTAVSRLHELDPVAIDRFLTTEGITGYTRNEYVGCIKAFTKWAVETRRLREDPLLPLRKTPRSKIDPAHPRRGITFEQVGLLIDVAYRRPLLERTIVRTGKNAGKPVGKVRSRVREKLERLGRERMLCYLITAWTGLRRNELRQLRWGDIDLEGSVPKIRLRAQTTKSKRADGLTLHPQVIAALRQAKPISAKPDDPVVRTVPDMKTFRADLRAAGIEPGDKRTGFVDFHALRMACNSNLAAAGITERIRQSHMRHTDPRLTANTYLDEKLLPIAEAIGQVPWIPTQSLGHGSPGNQAGTAESVTTPVTTVTTDLQQKTAVSRLDLTPPDYAGQEEIVELIIRGPRSQVERLQRIGQALA